jgi:hypothetical protein
MELYEIANQAIFDEPVEYKGIKIYPITVGYYQIVKAASSAFAINTIADTDIELIGLPYMEYLMKKAIKEPSFVHIWDIFNSILKLSFQEQIHSFKYEGDFLKLIVAVPTDQYNEETMCVYREKLNEYNELAKDSFHMLINERQIKKLRDEIDSLAGAMFVFHTFDDNDFAEIKKIICFLNDIDDTILDPRWEAELKKASEIMAQINSSKNPPDLEDLIDAVAFHLRRLPSEIKNMTIRRFDRYLDLEINKENYRLCRTAELNGTEFKQPLNHWLQKYKPKTRYSDAQNVGGGIQEVFKE